jgi:hypothetical protein
LATRIDNGAWHHVAAVFHRNQLLQVFIDGSPESMGLQSGLPPWASFQNVNVVSSHDLLIGATKLSGSPGQLLVGCIDEVRVYQGALTETQIQALYQEGLGSP